MSSIGSGPTVGGGPRRTGGLELRGIRSGYGPVETVHGIDLFLPAGSTVALLGRNGAGKSTLLRTIAGLVPVRSGSISWEGRDLTGLTAFQRAAAGITLVPDGRNVFETMTVADNLAVFGERNGIEVVLDVFPELGPLLDRPAATLSGGERQMVALAHVLLRPSPVVLLDEPSRGLSPAAVARITDAIARIAAADRLVVIVEQFLHDALRLADTVYVMRRGEIAFAGEPAELLTSVHSPVAESPG